MATRKPPVAVLVPTYNGAQFLAETLASIEVQSYANVRVLVRDDGSTDDTLAITTAFAERDNRFIVIPGGDHRGAEGNAATLVALAQEPFVKLATQDDPLHPRHIEKLLLPMVQDSDIAFAAAARQLIDSEGRVLPALAYNEPLHAGTGLLEGRSVARHMMLTRLNRIGEPATVIMRNGILDPARPFFYAGRDYLAMGDVAMWLTLLEHGPLHYTSEILGSFRQHESQCSQDLHVHYQCILEWAHLFEGALVSGLLARDGHARAAAVALVEWNQQVASAIVHNESREYDRHLRDVLDAILALWSALNETGSPADRSGARSALPGGVVTRERSEGIPLQGPDVEPVRGAARPTSVRIGPGWDAQQEWMTRLVLIAARFPGLAVRLPLIDGDDGTGSRSATRLRAICAAAGVDPDCSGDFSLDPQVPSRNAEVPPDLVPPGRYDLDQLEHALAGWESTDSDRSTEARGAA